MKTTRISAPLPPVVPALPEAVPPALRFMLEPAGRDDGYRFYKDVGDIGWHMRDTAAWAEKWIIGKMSTRWPAVARADEVIDGLLSDALRVVAANPRSFPRWWLSVAVCLANGHPERLRECCQRVLEHAGVRFDEHVTHVEEKADKPMREAVRHWQDRDALDDIIDSELDAE